jgi:hypothetical protein
MDGCLAGLVEVHQVVPLLPGLDLLEVGRKALRDWAKPDQLYLS